MHQINSKLKNWRWCLILLTWRRCQIFLFLGIDIGPRFMLVSLLVLELWRFLFIRVLTRSWVDSHRNFVALSGDWSKLGTLNFVWLLSPMSNEEMLQNVKLTTFTVLLFFYYCFTVKLFRDKQQRVCFSPASNQKKLNPSDKSIRKRSQKRPPYIESFGATVFIKCQSEHLKYYSDVFF